MSKFIMKTFGMNNKSTVKIDFKNPKTVDGWNSHFFVGNFDCNVKYLFDIWFLEIASPTNHQSAERSTVISPRTHLTRLPRVSSRLNSDIFGTIPFYFRNPSRIRIKNCPAVPISSSSSLHRFTEIDDDGLIAEAFFFYWGIVVSTSTIAVEFVTK